MLLGWMLPVVSLLLPPPHWSGFALEQLLIEQNKQQC